MRQWVTLTGVGVEKVTQISGWIQQKRVRRKHSRMLCLILIVGGLRIMMGQHDRSEALFYYIRLEDQVPEIERVRRERNRAKAENPPARSRSVSEDLKQIKRAPSLATGPGVMRTCVLLRAFIPQQYSPGKYGESRIA